MARQPAKTLEEVEKELAAKEVPKNKDDKAPRELVIEMQPDGLYVVRQDGGGKIPALLEGKFTSIRVVNDLIETYKKSK